VDVEKLRKYERDRLHYFYAIVDCDSASTAASIYQQCDGLVRTQGVSCGVVSAERRREQEFERSSTRIDLRYVPDEQSFDGRAVRDLATHVPPTYTPVDYTSKALQQTSVGLSWDADDPDRKKHLRRKITADQLKEEDFAAYLGSCSEDEGEDADAQARLACSPLAHATINLQRSEVKRRACVRSCWAVPSPLFCLARMLLTRRRIWEALQNIPSCQTFVLWRLTET
jgi:hypothetical protein